MSNSTKTIKLHRDSGSFEDHTTNANTVSDLLVELGITRAVSTSIGGSVAAGGDQLRDGDVVSIVSSNKRGGK